MCLQYLCVAGGQAWLGYFSMFDESRFVHVTSLDFLALTLLAPFWVLNDASTRSWSDRCCLAAWLLVHLLLWDGC